MLRASLRLAAAAVAFALAACNQTPPVPAPPQSSGTATESAIPVSVPYIDTSLPADAVLASSDAVANRIAIAASTFAQAHVYPNSTRGLFNAPFGDECVAAVQAVLTAAGLPIVASPAAPDRPVLGVDDFRAAIVADPKDWIRIDPLASKMQAAPGDIWIQGDGFPGEHAGQNHVGICEDWSCAHVVSNSSTRGSFTWSDTQDGYAQFYYSEGYPYLGGAIYHHR